MRYESLAALVILTMLLTTMTGLFVEDGFISERGMQTEPIGPRTDPGGGRETEYLMDYHPPPDVIDYPSAEKDRLGSEKILVLMVEFLDVRFEQGHDAEHYTKNILSSQPGSLNKYLSRASYEKYMLSGHVHDNVIMLNRRMQYYGQDDVGDGDGDGRISDDGNGEIDELITECLDQAVADGVNLGQYDSDHDNVVDHIMIVHAGEGQESTGSANDLYSRSSFLSTPYEGTVADVERYIIVSEYSPLGVLAQKTLVDLGARILLDRDQSTDGIGLWGLMGHGFRTGNGTEPVNPISFTKADLGWLDIDMIDTSKYDYVLKSAARYQDAAMLPLRASSDGKIMEYFLLENREREGNDAGLCGNGLLIWHVCTQLPNNDVDNAPLISLEEADNSGDLGTYGGDMGSETDAFGFVFSSFNDDTLPGSKDSSGITTGWEVRDISAPGDSVNMNIIPPENDVGFYLAQVNSHYIELGDDINLTLGIINYGVMATDCEVSIDILQFNTDFKVQSKNISLGRLSFWSNRTLKHSYTPAQTGRFEVRVELLVDRDMVNENNLFDTVVHATTFIFNDDVEGGNKGWTSSATLPLISPGWHIVSNDDANGDSYSPSHSWWCGFESSGMYQRAADFILESDDMNITGENAVLYFHHKYDISEGLIFGLLADGGYVEVSTNAGESWSEVSSYRGQGDWTAESLDLGPYLGSSNTIRIRFRINSNLVFLAGGWYVDDISVVGERPYYGLRLKFYPDSAVMYPGAEETFTTMVTNAGNTYEKVDMEAELINAATTLEIMPTSMMLEPWSTQGVKVKLKVPNTVQAGKELGLNIGAYGANSSAEGSVGISIGTLVDVDAKLDPDIITIYPPASEQGLMSINNRGNGEVFANIEAVDTGGIDVLDIGTNYKIGAYSEREIGFNISTQRAEPNTNHQVTFVVHIRSEASVKKIINDTYNLILKVNIGASHKVEIVSATSISVPVGEGTTVPININNLGNCEEELTLSGTASSKDVQVLITPNQVTLPKYTSSAAILQIDVGPKERDKSAAITIMGASAEKKFSASLELDIAHPELKVEGEERGGGFFEIRVENYGETKATSVELELFVDGKLDRTVPIGTVREGDSFTEYYKLDLKPGKHVILAKVGGAEAETNEEDNSFTMESEVKEVGVGQTLEGYSPLIAVITILIVVLAIVGFFLRKK